MNGTNDYSFERKYTLEAQTPLIHFQHGQQGATLRATEVKPKLDRFLLKKLKAAGEKIPKSWFVGESETALNYKLRLDKLGNAEPIDLSAYKIFYGNMQSDEQPRSVCNPGIKKGVMGNVCMTICCTVPKLFETIEKYLSDFFIVTGFGTMSGKGFGSYVVTGDAKKYTKAQIAEMLAKDAGAKNCYAISGYEIPGETTRMFEDISMVYSVMKAGHNRRSYHRSYLFEYFHGKQIGNEKAKMKLKRISPWERDGSQPVKHPDKERTFPEQTWQDYKYVRALLGVGESITYISSFRPGTDRNGNPIWKKASEEKIKISNPEIARLESPVKFTIIGNTIYMVAHRVNEKIFGKKFSFTNKTTKASTSLYVPDSFDIDEFLAWFVDTYNVDSKKRDEEGRKMSYSIHKTIETLYTEV